MRTTPTSFTRTAILALLVTAQLTCTDEPVAPSEAARFPVAVIASPVSCDGLTCTFDGRGSSGPDPRDAIASYTWAMGDSAGTILSGETASFTYDRPGTYTVALTVTDGAGLAHTHSMSVRASRSVVASFTSSCEGLSCTFTSTSTGASTYFWGTNGVQGRGSSWSYTYPRAGTYEVRHLVFGAGSAFDQAISHVTVPPLSATAPALSGTVGTAVSDTATATGGTPPYTFSKASGPSWLSVAASGAISGTPDSVGSFAYGVTVTDSVSATATATDTVTVAPRPPLSVTAPSLSGTVGTAISGTATASGGTPPYTFAKASGPSWLSVAASGAISGTPTTAGKFAYGVTVTDSASTTATATDTVTVAPAPLSVTAPSVSGTVGTAVSGTATASGGTPPYAFSKASGPDSLRIAADGTISGTFTAAGSFAYAVTVVDGATPPDTATATDTVTVAPAPLSVTAPSVSGTVGTEVSDTATATGGTPPYTFSKASGPDSLRIAADGTISGTFTVAGNFAYTVTVVDGATPPDTATATDTVTVASAPLSVTAPSVSGTVGTAISDTATATGGTPPYTFSKTSGPDSLHIAADGTISGTFTVAGNFAYTVTVVDGATPPDTATATDTVTVAPVPLSVTAPSVSGTVGTAVSDTATATGGTPPYTFSKASGPDSLRIAADGTISGTFAAAGSFAYAVRVIDGATPPDTATATDTITVNRRPVADFTWSCQEGPMACTFDGSNSSALGSGDSIRSYEWTMGDRRGTKLLGRSVRHTYDSLSSYSVTLKVTDTRELEATTRRKVWPEDPAPTVSFGTTLSGNFNLAEDCTPTNLTQLGKDLDRDGIFDNCEYKIASAFRPTRVYDFSAEWSRPANMHPHWIVTRGIPDKGHYAKYAPDYTLPKDVIGIFYALSYYEDPGFDRDGTGLSDHHGDSEMIVLWVRNTSGSTYELEAAFLSAHYKSSGWGVGDQSTMAHATHHFSRMSVINGRPTVWVTPENNANYPTRSACPQSVKTILGILDEDCWSNASRASVAVDSTRNLGSQFVPMKDSVYSPRNNTKQEAYWTGTDFSGWKSGSLPLGTADAYRPYIDTFAPHGAFSMPPTGGKITVRCENKECFFGPGPVMDDWGIDGIEKYEWEVVVTGLTENDTTLTSDVANWSYDLSAYDVRSLSFYIKLDIYDVFYQKLALSGRFDVDFSLRVDAPSLSGTAGTTFSDTVTASGGASRYRFSKVSSSPAWLTVDSITGVVRAAPSATDTGSFAYTVRVRDRVDSTATDTATVRVRPPCSALAVTAPDVSGQVGTRISWSVNVSGGCPDPPRTFSKVSGPSWLSISNTGGLSGTSASAGTFPYSVRVTDSRGNTATDSGSIKVCSALSVTAPNLSGTVGTSMSRSASASGGCPPRTFSKVSGPSWLSVSSSGGLSGTPSSADTFSYSVRVTDSAGFTATDDGSIVVRPQPCSALSVTAPNASGTVGTSMSWSASASGGCPPRTFSKASGPSWLSVSSTGGISGTPPPSGGIEVTPSSADTYSYRVRVTDSQGNTATDGGTITVCSALSVTAPNASGTVGTSISRSVSASGGCPPRTFSKVSGPSWLSVSNSGGISGTPSTADTYSYRVRVTDSRGNTATDGGSIVVRPRPCPTAESASQLSVSAPQLSGRVGTGISGSATASGGCPPYTFSKSSGPSWLTVSSSGSISGTPSSAGRFTYSVLVTDTTSATATATNTIAVTPPPLSVTVPNFLTVVNRAISGTAHASGGRLRYTFSKVSGPSWLSVSTSGAISGTPTTSGSFSYRVRVTDSLSATATATGTVRVNPRLSLSVGDFPAAPDESFSFGISASGGLPPYRYVLSGGPDWLSISSSTGTLSGVPPETASGSYSFVVTVTDSIGARTFANGSISVEAERLSTRRRGGG